MTNDQKKQSAYFFLSCSIADYALCAEPSANKHKSIYFKVSPRGKNLIKRFESLMLSSYRDIDVWSIGYGSRSPVNYPYTITRAKAEQLFNRDIARLEKWLNIMISRHNPAQHEFDAIASWAYNIGPGAALSSSLIRKYNRGEDPHIVANQFTNWIYTKNGKKKIKTLNKGLFNRRKMERALFLNRLS